MINCVCIAPCLLHLPTQARCPVNSPARVRRKELTSFRAVHHAPQKPGSAFIFRLRTEQHFTLIPGASVLRATGDGEL